ncbi:hypothetical protein [Lapillicoccus sp.]|uniref:hypothetical protein n=1 Tax=Lapillicoccus sp. TaxID=1909287 RepID=UPI0025CF8793|nr:hypothetical protein [Lapillicoccus sp.]
MGDTIDATELGTRMTDAMAKAKTGRGTFSVNDGTSSTTMTESMQFVFGATPQAQGTLTVAGMTVVLLIAGGVAYMKGLPVQMTGGKPWVKIDPKGTDSLSRSVAQLGTSLADPRGALAKSLRGRRAKVIAQGGGLTTFDITSAALAGSTMVLTIDALDRPVTSTVTLPKATLQVTYTDWGSPVTITVPPADQIGTVPAATATS